MGTRSADSPLPRRAEAHRRSSSAASSRPSSRRSSASQRRSGRPARKRGGWGRKIGLAIVFAFLTLAIAGLGGFLFMYSQAVIPKADDLALAQKTTVYYSDGTTEMGSLGDIDRQIIDPKTLPDHVGHAVVASEDRTFYKNSGVDLQGILRALFNNVTTGSRQGGSTLTQQYVERYYFGETTSYTGKAREAVLAIKINREQSKDQILGNYLNTIYFGRGAYGIEAASRAYFDHPAKDLTLAESAMLAGIIPAPSAWDPAVDEEQARSRFQRVLGLMVEDGWISQAEADAAVFPTAIDPATQDDPALKGPNGYLIEQVRSELTAMDEFTDEDVASGGFKIVTTIDKTRQDAAVAAAQTMDSVSGWDPDSMHVALSSIDSTTGEIVAEYAGADYLTRQQNAVTQDIAMAGSAFKPFALLANARVGGAVTDRYNGNSPQRFDGLESPVSNDGGYSFGKVDLVQATQYSMNTAFVALNEKVGPASTQQAAIDAGIPEDTAGLDATLLNVLGFASPHNLDITNAYATLANGGSRMTPHIVRTVTDAHGNISYQASTESTQVFTSEQVSSIMPALQSVTARGGTADQVVGELGNIKSAGKTGTSQEQLSAQFAGFVPGLSTTVSMYQSNADGAAVPLANIGGLDQFHGGDWPVDVWLSYMKAIAPTLSQTDFSWYVPVKKKPQPEPQSSPEEKPQSAETEPQQPDQQRQNTQQSPPPSTNGGNTGGGTGNTGGTTNPGNAGNTGNTGNTGGAGTPPPAQQNPAPPPGGAPPAPEEPGAANNGTAAP